MTQHSCRLCGEGGLVESLCLERAPRSIGRVLTAEQVERDRPITLRVFRCRDCGFVQLAEMLEDDYYDEYVMTATHSAKMRAFQSEQAHAFVERFALVEKRVIEVGCGDGNYLTYLTDAGARAVGLEPSRPYRAMAATRGFEVLSGYVGRDVLVPGAPYEAFVSRQVLEHVPDPNDFLQGVRSLLAEGGVGLVEVPSLEKALEDGRFQDFFSDHLNYFSLRTLRMTLERNGFDVLETQRVWDGEFNVALVRKATDDRVSVLQDALDQLVGQMRVFVRAQVAEGHRVAVWGAGGKGLTIMAVAGTEGIAYVVDSDPNKVGLFTPVGHLPVCPPEQLLSDPVDAVILTAVTYRDEIIRQIRSLGFRGIIAVFHRSLEIVPGMEGEQ